MKPSIWPCSLYKGLVDNCGGCFTSHPPSNKVTFVSFFSFNVSCEYSSYFQCVCWRWRKNPNFLDIKKITETRWQKVWYSTSTSTTRITSTKKTKKTTKKLIDALYTPYDTQSTSMPYCNKHHSINSLHARRDNHLVSDKRMTQEFQAPVLTSLELFQTFLVLSP